MTTLINKESTQHYANKMVLAENRKVGSKSLPTALNEIDALIDEMKTYFDAEYGSALDMKLENNENVFSVGTGTNVDKRSEVENSFTDVELSGNSLVNLCVTDVGRLHFVADGTPNIKHYKTTAIKPNTKYTIITNVLKNTINNNLGIVGWNITDDYNQVIIPREYVGLFKGCFTTNDTIREVWELDFWKENTIGEIEIENIIILEGDWTNKPVPQYFQGLKSVGEKEDGNHKISISSVGKNLLDPSTIAPHPNYGNSFYQATFDGEHIIFDNKGDTSKGVMVFFNKPIYLEKGCSYKTIIESDSIPLSSFHNSLMFGVARNDGSVYCTISNKGTITTLNNIESGWYWCRTEIPKGGNSGKAKITLTKETTLQKHEPYKEDKKEISLNEPLRGLPNGVRDTIEKINGEWKIVRRCGCFTLNGSEQWNTPLDGNVKDGNTKLFEKSQGFESLDNTSINIISDKFPSYNANFVWSNDLEGISINKLGTFHLRINTSKLSEITSNELKNWLAQNPVKCVYKLATPVIEDISPITLQCWKNATISIDAVLPVETTHTVALNKSAQIQKNIEELSILRNRIEALEKQYNNSTLNQAYELELLRLDMQLDNII